jgi:hypothetical protein
LKYTIKDQRFLAEIMIIHIYSYVENSGRFCPCANSAFSKYILNRYNTQICVWRESLDFLFYIWNSVLEKVNKSSVG